MRRFIITAAAAIAALAICSALGLFSNGLLRCGACGELGSTDYICDGVSICSDCFDYADLEWVWCDNCNQIRFGGVFDEYEDGLFCCHCVPILESAWED